MSRELNQQDSSALSQALQRFIEAGEELRKAPRFSHRADMMVDDIGRAVEVAKKIRGEVDPSTLNLPDTPANLPDSGRGDFDTKGARGTVPHGMTSTDSMQYGHQNKDTGQTFGQQDPPQRREGVVPGLSGHPVKKDDRERRGNTFNVDSTSHREAAAGELGRVNADTLPGPAKDDSVRDAKSDPREMDVGADGNPANVSVPEKQGDDTTNTSTEGAGKPDNFFATHGGNPDEPRKYDSANRVATETLGHERDKKVQEDARRGESDVGENAKEPNTDAARLEKDHPQHIPPTEQSDKAQNAQQGDETAKRNKHK